VTRHTPNKPRPELARHQRQVEIGSPFRRPREETSAEFGAQLGNYDQKQLNADFTGSLNDDGSLLYRFVALGKDSGTQVEHADGERVLAAVADVAPNESPYPLTQEEQSRR
jgi:iron complex outermembrane receptor protein